MDADLCAGIERRREEGKSHDVVPMEMGQEKIIDLAVALAVPPQRIQAEWPETASHVTDEICAVAGLQLDAGCCAAISRSGGKAEFFDEALRVGRIRELFSIGRHERSDDFPPDGVGGGGNRKRPSSTPETHDH